MDQAKDIEGPCIVVVKWRDERGERFYGPFADERHAHLWVAENLEVMTLFGVRELLDRI